MSENAGTGKTIILERGSFGRFKVAILVVLKECWLER